MRPDICEICGKKSKNTIICDRCVKRHKITEDKSCGNCDFYKEEICIISSEKINKDYYCLFFLNRGKK